MKAFLAFCKKEFVESLRTYRLLIMLAAFVLFGLMSPLVAKLLPEILNGSDIGGIAVQIPEPTALDSWMQFFKNIGQMGVLVLVIVFCGLMANEFSKGTLVNILTKGMKRHTVILAKFTVASLVWALSYVLAWAVTFAYTIYFWESGELPNAFLAFVSPWVFGLLLLALMILGGTLFKSFYGSLLMAGGTIIALSLAGIIPGFERFNPLSLAGGTVGLLAGHNIPGDFIPALLITLAATVLLVGASIAIFNKKQL